MVFKNYQKLLILLSMLMATAVQLYAVPLDRMQAVGLLGIPGTDWLGISTLLAIVLAIAIVRQKKKMDILLSQNEDESDLISEQEEISRQLKQQTNDLEQILGAIPSGLIVFDAEFRVQTVNESFLHQFNIDSEALLGKYYKDAIIRHKSGQPVPSDQECDLIVALDKYRKTLQPVTNQVARTICFSEGTRSIRYSITGFGENSASETLVVIDDITEYVQTARLRQFSVAVAAGITKTQKIHDFYRVVHEELNKLITADNFYIAIIDKDRNKVTFPFVKDEKKGSEFSVREIGNGLTETLIKAGSTVLFKKGNLENYCVDNKIKINGTIPESYLAAPLMGEDGAFGLIAVQDYNNDKLYQLGDKDLLHVVAGEIAKAIEHKRIRDSIFRAKIEWERSVDVIPDMIAIIDDHKRILRVNRAMADKLGMEPQEAVGISCVQTIRGMQSPFPFCDHFEMLESSGKNRLEINEKRWNGDYLVTIIPLYDKSKQLIGNVYHAFNITESKYIENALRESEKRLEMIFSKSLDVIIVVDPENGKIIGINPVVKNLLGYEPKQLIGKNFDSIFPTEPQVSRQEMIDSFNLHGAIIETQRFKHADGSVVELDLTASLIPWGSGKAIIATLRDVTERRETKKALSDSQSQYQQLVNNAPLGILSADPNGNILQVNPALINILGYSSEQDVRQLNLLSSALFADSGISEMVRKCIKTKKLIISEYTFSNLQNKSIHIKLYLTPNFDTEDKISSIQGIVEDITDLKLDEARLKTILDSVPDAILYQTGGGVEYISPSIEEVLGYKGEQFTTDHTFFLTAIAPEDLEVTKRIHKRWRDEGSKGTVETEFRAIHKNGSKVWLLDRMTSAFINPDGQHSYMGVMINITDRKNAEARLRRLASFPNLNPNPIVEVSIENDLPKSLTYFNDAATTEFPNLVSEGIRNPIFIGIQEPIASLHHDINKTIVHKTKYNDKIFELHFSYVISGDVVRIYIIDVTEREQAEEKVRISEKFNRDLVTEAPVGIAYLEKDGTIMFCNPIFVEMMDEEDSSALISQSVFDVFSGNRVVLMRYFKKLLRGSTIQLDEIMPIRFHAKKSFNLHGAPRYGAGGEVIGAMLMVVDVSEYKKLHGQLRHASKMEAVGTLAGGIAHDFNNALTAILGNTQLAMIKLKADSDEMVSLNAIKRSANRAADLTSQLLAFGRGRMQKPQAININNSVKEIVELLHRTIDPKIEMTTDLNPELWRVMADSSQMNQVLMNLCVNAPDAMTDGGLLKIKTDNFIVNEDFCRTRSYAKEGNYVLLTVSDTGLGISPEVIPHIFEPFFSTKKTGKGTGLGLAMVYSIVKAHNGWIDVNSKKGFGTTFSIYLPQIKKAPTVEVAATSESYPGGFEQILLVDDQKMVLDAAGGMLESVGYQVVKVESSQNAIDLFRAQREAFDLVILDLSLPKISGEEVLKELLQIDSDAIVIVSGGFNSGESSKKLLQLGAKLHIQKPYRMHELLGAIRSVLDVEDNTNTDEKTDAS